MKQEPSLLTVKNQPECLEENVIVDDESLLYSLSNSLDEIEVAIFTRTGKNMYLKNVYWKLNAKLFNGVKRLMKKHQVRYSMTVSIRGKRKDLVVNMRVNEEWFTTGFTEFEGAFLSWDMFEKIDFARKYIKEHSDSSLEKLLNRDPEVNEKLTIDKFIIDLDSLFKKRRNEDLTSEELICELSNLVELYIHLKPCKGIKSYNLDRSAFFLFMCFCHLFINNNDDRIGFNDLKPFYENRIIVHEIIRSLSEGEHVLIKNKYIECNDKKDPYNSKTWRLSGKTKMELFSIICREANKNSKNDLILFDAVKDKEMFYNSRECEAVRTLTSVLMEENYQKILERLNARDMPKGFACLLSGEPGTGKTETAFQIARKTKRNIMKVDISEIKSCWVGESERYIKEVFEDYRSMVNSSEIAPILLLNEADGIIHKRRELDAKSGSADKSDNAVQNIILEEMENLSGILIATSNLVRNMDTAFERRFLYKITFDKPDTESRKGIWNSLLPELSKNAELKELAVNFELSGGQIENIARKVEIDSILNGSIPSMDTLLRYCKDESLNCFTVQRRIGFNSEAH